MPFSFSIFSGSVLIFMIAWLSVAELVKHIGKRRSDQKKDRPQCHRRIIFLPSSVRCCFHQLRVSRFRRMVGMPAVFALLSLLQRGRYKIQIQPFQGAQEVMMYSLSCWVAVAFLLRMGSALFDGLNVQCVVGDVPATALTVESMGGGSEAVVRIPTSNCCCDGSAIRVSRNC